MLGVWCGVFAGVRTFRRDGLSHAEGLEEGSEIGTSSERSRFFSSFTQFSLFFK